MFILAPDAPPLLRDTRCNAPQTTFKFFVLPRQQIWNWLEFSTNWKNVRMLKVAESPLYVSHLHLPLSLTWLVARQSLELASIASRLPSFFRWLLLETTLRDLFWRWSYPESHPLNWYYLKNYVAAVWHWLASLLIDVFGQDKASALQIVARDDYWFDVWCPVKIYKSIDSQTMWSNNYVSYFKV